METSTKLKFYKDQPTVLEKSFSVLPDGTKHGLYQEFYLDGTLKTSVAYKNGARDGPEKRWYENGKIKEIDLLRATKKGKTRSVGVYQKWHENGQLMEKGEYNERGCRTGFWFEWDDTGKRVSKCHYKDYEQDGPQVLWWRHGEGKREKGKMLCGKKDGHWRFWFENGVLGEKGSYLKDEKVGQWETWFEDGAKRKLETFSLDTPDGYSFLISVKEWWPNGQLKYKKDFGTKENSVCVGKEWRKNGNLKHEYKMTRGPIFDVVYYKGGGKKKQVCRAKGKKFRIKAWHNNGTIRKRGQRKLGKDGYEGDKIGLWSYWDVKKTLRKRVNKDVC